MTEIDPFSLTTVPIELYFNKTPLGHATSFVWKHHNNRHFLITNWHVVSGRDASTRQYLKSHAGRPNKLHALFNFGGHVFGKQPVEIAIRDEEDAPQWLIHPSQGAGVDVVAIPLPYAGDEPTISLNPINTLSAAGLLIRISMEVFILGYPFGVEPPGYPVWKRGSIATEPDLVRLGPQYLLVDTASRPGMSGAPVIRRSWTNHLVDSNYVADNSRIATKFIGVYSGRRLAPDRSDTQLGMVWPDIYIPEIIAGNMRDDDSLY
jgi:Trypsin-like peptidase domain